MNKNGGRGVMRLIGLILASAVACAAMSSCSAQSPDKYAELNNLSVANDKRPNSQEASDAAQDNKEGTSIKELPATFSEPEYSFGPETGKLVRVSTPNMYSSKIPDKYVVSTSSSSEPSSESSQSSKEPETPKPQQPSIPLTSATGSAADLTSAQRQKITTLISSNLLDKESFENTGLGADQMIGAALLLGSDKIQYGFDTYIEKDILSNLCKDLFGKTPFSSGSKLSSSYIILKSDKCNIKKMPESNYYSKAIGTIYDVGNGYYKVETELYSNETKAGNAVYIIKADSASTHGYVIAAQKIN